MYNEVLKDLESFLLKEPCNFPSIFEYGREYCESIRGCLGINDISYVNSLIGIQNAFQMEEEVSKSRSMFAVTKDKSFILKSLNNTDFEILKDLLPLLSGYFQRNSDSLIARIVGAYEHSSGAKFFVMENIRKDLKTVHEQYDLKGSVFGRERRRNPLCGKVILL